MGMFDTFYGKVKCPYCGEYHDFEEQTKAYTNMCESYKLGNYIEDKDKTYKYPFEVMCDKYKEKFKANIIVYNGQIVNFLNDYDSKFLDMSTLQHIDENLGYKLEYQERCKVSIGYVNECGACHSIRYANEPINWNEHPKDIGDTMFVLGKNWMINRIYAEKLIPTEKDNTVFELYKWWYAQSYVYKVHGELGNRIIRVTKNNASLWYDKGDYNSLDIYNINNFYIQHECVLKEL